MPVMLALAAWPSQRPPRSSVVTLAPVSAVGPLWAALRLCEYLGSHQASPVSFITYSLFLPGPVITMTAAK